MRVPFRTALRKTAVLTAAICLFAAATQPAEAKPDMTDQAIGDKIEDELLLDQGVVSTKVDVSLANGIVTLTGNVNNILAKERAARITQAVKGVRAVVNRIEVSPSTTRPDAQIRLDVESALLVDPATESYQITTSVERGEVTLTGTVDSYQERELAKIVAKGVRGVKAIDDQIKVDYKTDRADYEIKKEIEQALRWNMHVDNYLVNVTVNDGKVSLSGTVGSAAEKRIAESDAWVAGVTLVDTSELSVSESNIHGYYITGQLVVLDFGRPVGDLDTANPAQRLSSIGNSFPSRHTDQWVGMPAQHAMSEVSPNRARALWL